MKTTNHPITFESNPFKSTFTGFGNFFKYNQTIAIVLLVISNISLFFQFFGGGGGDSKTSTTSTSSTSGSTMSSGETVAIIALVLGITAAFFIIGLIISALVNGMITYAAYKTSKGEPTTIAEAFRETKKRFGAIYYATVVSALKVLGGLLLFIVPGIRASLRYQMVVFPIFDEDLRGKQALQRIKFLTKDHLLEMFGIMTVANLLAPINILLQKGGESIMYPQLKALKESNAPKPPVHWLNYLGFILFAAFLLLVLAIVLIVVAVLSAR